jgi:hypothetical protein
MSNFSLTYTGIVVMVLAWVAQRMKLTVSHDQLQATVETIILFAGALIALYGRWRKGDLNIFGFKKSS